MTPKQLVHILSVQRHLHRSRQAHVRLEARELALHTISALVTSVAHDLKHSMATIGNCVAVIERKAFGIRDIGDECDAIRRAAHSGSERMFELNRMLNPRSQRREIVSMRSIVSRFRSQLEGI